MTTILNPVIRGFAPDPSTIRVGEFYYVATSSFQWYPAIPIHRSRDLASWHRIGAVADGPGAGWDLRGVADSCGVWAPSPSHDGERFWFVAFIVREDSGGSLGLRTLLTCTLDPAAGWDAPIRVPSTGFDPALFDEDGRVWLINMQLDPRPTRERFAGITLHELDSTTARPLTEPRLILKTGTLIEGPNIIRTPQGYLLAVAEGATGWNHGIMCFRSDALEGPYHRDPEGPLLTARDAPGHPLQRADHGELVTDPAGTTFVVHLASRVGLHRGERRSLLDRETVVQRVAWDAQGRPRLAGGGALPAVEVDLERDPEGIDERPRPWCTLRRSSAGWAISSDAVVLTGWDGLSSCGEAALIARRFHESPYHASVVVHAAPRRIEHAAGLVLYSGTGDFVAALCKVDDRGDPVNVLRAREGSGVPRQLGVHRLLNPAAPVRLKLQTRQLGVRFSFALDKGRRRALGPPLDSLNLSDEHAAGLRFTGPLVGIVAIDELEGTWTARFTDIDFDLGLTTPTEEGNLR